MKNILIAMCLVMGTISLTKAQGLEGLIIENYYVSDSADAAGSEGILPEGSTTWRIYVDLLPGYTLQAVYGVDVAPTGSIGTGDHELRLETTTTFFNNEDRCGTAANDINFNFIGDNTVMLDSWVSVGAAADGKSAVRKSNDDGTNTIVNNDGLLQNNDAAAGIPLTTEDGFASSGTPEDVTFVGFTTELNAFDCTSQTGNLLSTYNASWASLNGATGPTATNEVLIAQVTTDGILSYELNIQVGTPTGGVENYVARNAVGDEILFPELRGFVGGCLTPTNLMASVTGPQTVTLSWDPVPGALGYELTGGVAGNPSSYVPPITRLGENNTTFDVIDLCIDFSYEWTVRTICDASSTSDYAELNVFTTDVCASAGPASTIVNGNGATLMWNEVNGAIGYLITGQAQGGSLVTLPVFGGGTTSFQVNNLPPANYLWQVQPACALSTVCVGAVNFGPASSSSFTIPGPAAKNWNGDMFNPVMHAEVEVFPNPASNRVTIQFADASQIEQMSIEMYNLEGKLMNVSSEAVANNLVLNTSNLENGAYYIIMQGDKQIIKEKLIIVR